MDHTLTVNLSEEVYALLSKAAQQMGEFPETLAVRWLTTASQHLADDPVEQFIGALQSPVHDWADHHDTYLGSVIMETMKDTAYQGTSHE